MKKIMFLMLSAITMIVAAGQRTRLNLYSAYMPDGSYISVDNNNYYSGKINAGLQFGGGIEYLVQPQCSVELMYLGQHTVNSTYNATFDLGLNYLLAGCNYYTKNPHENLQGFAGLSAGLLLADIDNPDKNQHVLANKFCWSAKLGCNIWAGRMGIKLQAQLLSSILSMRHDVHMNSLSLDGFATILQFGVGGGLTYQLAK